MKKIIGLISIFCLVISSFIGCGKSSETSSKTLNVGYFPNVTHGQALLIKSENKDSNISFKKFNSGPSALEALLAGAVDISYIGLQPSLNGYIQTNGDLVVISSVANGGANLIVKDKNIVDANGLKGKKIAVPEYGNSQDLQLRAFLKEHGLKDKKEGGDIEIVAAPNPDIKALLEKGEIDGALVPEPWTSELKEIGKELYPEDKLLSVGKVDTAVILARKDFVEKNPEMIKDFVKKHYEATETIKKNQDQSIDTIIAEIKKDTGKELDKKIVQAAFQSIDFKVEPNYKTVDYLANISYELGLIKKQVNSKDLYRLIKN